jgi:hypothetical protein
MWYLAVIVALVIVLATAGLIQVLWLELAFILDETLPPHEGFDGSEGFPVPARIAPHTLQNLGRSQARDNPR